VWVVAGALGGVVGGHVQGLVEGLVEGHQKMVQSNKFVGGFCIF
jgi:hypothetical protein